MFAFTVTLIMGILFTALSLDFVNASGIGTIVAVCFMGAFIIYFNEKKK